MADGSIELDTELKTEGFLKGSDELLQAIKSLQTSIDSLGTSITQNMAAASQIMQDFAQAMAQASSSGQTSAAQSQLDLTDAQIASLRELIALHEQDAQTSGAQKQKAATDAVTASIEKQEAAAAKLDAKIDAKKAQIAEYYAYKDAVDAAVAAEREKVGANGRMNATIEMEMLNLQKVTEQYAKQLSDIAALEQEYSALTASINAAKQAQAASSATEPLQGGESTGASEELIRSTARAQAFAESMDHAKSVVSAGLTAAMHGLGLVASTTWSGIQAGASAALSGMSKLAKLAGGALLAGLKKAGSALMSFFKRSNEGGNIVKGLTKTLTSFKTILISRLKRTFISSLINQAKEGLQSLARFDSGVNQSMSNIKNAMSGASANLSVSLGSIITAIEPVITRIINAISTAITYLNAFFAMLSGKGTMTVAKKQTDSYAGALDSAAGAAKELNRQVYGFDELNKRQDNSGGGGGAGSLFEEVSIESMLPQGVDDFFEALYSAFEGGRWEEVGAIIASGLNVAVATVDGWVQEIQPKAVEWAGNIADILNGAIHNLNWSGIGQLFGDGLNTVTSTINEFAYNVDWDGFGSGIATGLNKAMQTTDFGELGKTLMAKLNILLQSLHGFVTTFDWTQLGLSLSNGLTGAWNSINWASAGETLGEGVKGLLHSINTTMESMNWQQIGNDVATFIKNIDWSGIVSEIAEGIGAALGGLTSLLWGLIEEAWGNVVQWWRDTAYEDGEFTMQGLLDGIWEKIKDIGIWIYDHIFKPFIDGFKNAFGINSPSTVMKEQGNFITQGLLNGIKEKWADITNWLSTKATEIKDKLTQKWGEIKSAAATKWNEIKESIKSKFSPAKTDTDSISGNIKSKLSDAWTSVKNTTSTKWQEIKDKVKSKFKETGDQMRPSDWTNIAKNLISGLKNGIVNNWSTITSKVNSLFGSLVSSIKKLFGIHSPSRVMAEIGEYLDEGFVKGLVSGEGGVFEAAAKVAKGVSERMGGEATPVLSVDPIVDGVDYATTRLERLADVFQRVGDAIAQIGGFTIPGIAAGAVVPPKTRVDSLPALTVDNITQERFASDVDERLSDVTALLRALIDATKQSHRGVDMDALTRAVTAGQRAYERNYGGII